MKLIITACLILFFTTSSAVASTLNLDPYFTLGSSSMEVEIGGTKSSAPSVFVAVGTALNWISPNLGAELRFGFGGQYTTFNGDINLYTSYLLKPSFGITRQFDVYALAGATTMSVAIAGTNHSGTGLSYGAGLTYHIPNESLSITGEWMSYYTSTSQSTTSISGMDITGISLGVTFEYY